MSGPITLLGSWRSVQNFILALAGAIALFAAEGSWLLRIVMAVILFSACTPVALIISTSAALLAVLDPPFAGATLHLLPIVTIAGMVVFRQNQRAHWQFLSHNTSSALSIMMMLALATTFTAALFEPYDWRIMLLTALLILWMWRGAPASLTQLLSPANLLLLAFSTVLAFGVLELGGRQITPWQGMYGYCDPDQQYLYTLRKDVNVVSSAERYPGIRIPLQIVTSSQGLRDRFYGPKRDDEIRIALVGDSYTFGAAVDLPDSIAKQLESFLNRHLPDRHVSVIVCGLSGYAPWQELAMFRERALPLAPDIVLFQSFVMNDIGESLSQEGTALQAYPNMHILRMAAANRHAVGRADLWLERHSGFYRTVQDKMQQRFMMTRLYNACRLLPDIPLLPYPPSADRPWWMEVHLAHWYPELEHAWDLFQRDVLRLRDLCADSGIPFLACNIPHPYLPEELDGILLESPPGLYERDKALHLVHDFFDKNDIPQCDLVPVVRSYRSPEALYYPADGHFTPAGNRVIAEVLASFLMDRAIGPMIQESGELNPLH